MQGRLWIVAAMTGMTENGAVRSYKAVSAKGLAYGKNLVNPKAQGETQPYWFHNTFPQLLKELNV